MILYFDNFITNSPLGKANYPDLEFVRKAEIYKSQSRLDVAKYILASYSVIPFTKVIIKYTLEDETKNEEFEDFIHTLWEDAIIIKGRSDSRRKFQESLKLINSIDDEWIFYAGNCDHAFIDSDLNMLNECLKKVEELKTKHNFVSIIYSHFQDIYTVIPQRLEEDKNCVVTLFPSGYHDTVQIINKNMFNELVSGDNDAPMIRMEEMNMLSNQILVVPKKEICRHYDGYSHSNVSSDVVPPLFIPPGFFTNEIRIVYNSNKYKKDWININSQKEQYIFRDDNGIDLKGEIPLFWKDRIKEIERC